MSMAVHWRGVHPGHDARMTTQDRRPAPSSSDARVGLLALLLLVLGLAYGVPVAILLWRAAL
jgi:hypothetical protein